MNIYINWFDINGEDDSLTLYQGIDFETKEGNSLEEAIKELMKEEEINSSSAINIDEDEGYAVVTTAHSLGVVAPIDHPIHKEIDKMRQTITKISKLGNLY